MKEQLSNMFPRRYSAISQKDDNIMLDQKLQNKSLSPKRSLSRGFSIVDSFFNEREAGKTTRWPKCTFLLMAGGLLAIAVAILVKVFQPYDLIFRWKLVFEEGGEIFNLWEKPPIDLYIKIYLFNITNAEAYMAGREKMRVEEIGPYVYKEIFQHDNTIFNDNNTVSSNPRHPLVWQEELSEGRKEDDVLMMVNIALLSIAQVAADRSYFVRLPINLLIRQTKSQPIVQMTAREFMFGYATQITTLGNTFLPDWISFDKVGLIDRMYDFDSDYETFFTGSDDPSKSGLYATYRGSKNLPQWGSDEHCSNIEMASDGTKFRSFMQPNDTALFFRKSMCRAQRLVRTGEETQVSGLQAYKMIFEDNALDNGYYDERNKCFCKNGYCQPRGLSDVTDCYYGFPISLSYPHFLDSDPKLLEDVEGLRPNRLKHESHFMINPVSGLPLNCSVKFQINMHMRDVRSMAHVERFSEMTLPMLWFEIAMFELPKPLQSRFNLYLNILSYIDPLGFWGGLALGALCLILAVVQAVLKMPQFLTTSQKTYSSRTDKSILRSNVYQPCEMKLIEVKEKCSIKPSRTDEKMIICNMELNNERSEQEPVTILVDGEDNAGCDNVSSSNSSNSITSDNNNSNQYLQLPDAVGECSSENDSEIGNFHNNTYNNMSYQRSRHNSERAQWEIGEASSLIDDIVTDRFSAQISSSEDEERRSDSDDTRTKTQVSERTSKSLVQ